MKKLIVALSVVLALTGCDNDATVASRLKQHFGVEE